MLSAKMLSIYHINNSTNVFLISGGRGVTGQNIAKDVTTARGCLSTCVTPAVRRSQDILSHLCGETLYFPNIYQVFF